MKSIEEEVDALFEEWNVPDSPGCVVGVIKDGEFVYKKGFGMGNLNDDIPITPATVFRIASLSKQFTAYCIALLEADGSINRLDDIRKYFPELPVFDHTIQVQNLIHHTSGIAELYDLFLIQGLTFKQLDAIDYIDFIKIISNHHTLNFQPGTQFLYSNSGYILLSMLIKRISGKSLSEFAEERIFKPLQMKSTLYLEDQTKIIKRRALGYSKQQSGDVIVAESNLEIAGDGAIFTSLDDFLLWDKNYYSPKIGTEELIQKTITAGSLNSGDPVPFEEMTYAYGLGIGSHRGLKTVSHGGSWVGFKSHMVRFPTQRFTVVIFANVKEFTPGYLAIKIAELYLENDFTEKKKEISSEKPVEVPPVIELPSEVLRKYCGFYYNQKMNAFIEITEEAKQLKLDFNKGMIYFLAAPIGEQKFLSVKDSPSSLSFLPKGENKWELKALMPGIPVELCFQQVTLYSYTPEKFKDYMGSYHCPSLNSHYEITKEGEELVFNIQHQHFQLMRTPEKDQFIIQAFGVQVTFLRPSQHKVEKIQLDAQRTKKIELIRV